jgi:uncharacterized protein YukE
LQALNAQQDALNKSLTPIPDRLDRLEAALNKNKQATEVAGGGVDKFRQKVDAAADALRDRMNKALDDANDKLQQAKDRFADYKADVASAITGVINFGDAAEYSAERGGVTFFDALQRQADKAKAFGALVDQLLAAGLSKEALGQVLDAGVEAGSFIAKQLLESSENILRANRLVEETAKIAQAIGQRAAEKFYQAGIANGEAYVRGVEEAIARATAKLAAVNLTPADVKGIGAKFDDSVARLMQPVAPVPPAAQGPFDDSLARLMESIAPVPPAAQGPFNDSLARLMQPVAPVPAPVESPITVTVNTVTAPANLGDIIVDALQDYNRRSGPLQLQIE